jgi:hypothetical protein
MNFAKGARALIWHIPSPSCQTMSDRQCAGN